MEATPRIRISAVESDPARHRRGGAAATALRRIAVHAAIFVAVIVVWETGSRAGYLNPLILPAPGKVAQAMYDMYFVTGLIGVIVVEFASAAQGVGVLMQRFSFQLDIASSVAVLLTMLLMGLILFTLMEFLDTAIVFWSRDSRLAAVSRKRARRFRP